MAYNKVVYGGNTLIDLTDLDVTAGDVVNGVTFIMADGTKAVGTITIPTKISDLTDDVGLVTGGSLSNFLVTELYSSGALSWSAGTIGTRATQVSVNIEKANYTPISATITYVSSSTSFVPVAFFSNDLKTLYMNAYRCTSTAVSSTNGIEVTVLYIKTL